MCGILCLFQYDGELSREECQECLDFLKHRGPDSERSLLIDTPFGQCYLGFQRLAIVDTREIASQPYHDGENYLICNGEIYNDRQLIDTYQLETKTNCDCEVILPLIQKTDIRTALHLLDAEYALVLYDGRGKIIASRDRYGVRPLFYGYDLEKKIFGFSSEMKALHPLMKVIRPVEPSSIVEMDLNVVGISMKKLYTPLWRTIVEGEGEIKTSIRGLLTRAVEKRLRADRPIGFLLSGGLDSSLIVAIATRILGPEKVTCFSVGLSGSADIEASKKVAAFLKIKHHVITFTAGEGLDTIPEVVRIIESYDVTTIRASVPQYLMSRYIKNTTDIRVLLSGEGSDEIHGSYRYFRDAPDSEAFSKETARLLKDLYLFDNLRTDRTMAANGLEVRVPFLDLEYVQFIQSLSAELLMYREGYMEKQILRDSFKGYLPEDILYRSKEAFSDAVSSREIYWYQIIQKYALQHTTEDQYDIYRKSFNVPESREALCYRILFDFYYPGREFCIPYYWLPKWQKTKIVNPSATILPCY